MTTYTQEQVNEIIREQTERIEAAHFEEQTKEILGQINKRLDESNNYKATIGKDVKNVATRIEAIELSRQSEVLNIKNALVMKERSDQQRRAWWQDWWIRVGILTTIGWEVVNILVGGGGLAIHHLIFGK